MSAIISYSRVRKISREITRMTIVRMLQMLSRDYRSLLSMYRNWELRSNKHNTKMRPFYGHRTVVLRLCRACKIAYIRRFKNTNESLNKSSISTFSRMWFFSINPVSSEIDSCSQWSDMSVTKRTFLISVGGRRSISIASIMLSKNWRKIQEWICLIENLAFSLVKYARSLKKV